jgi:hypothetical protein
MQQEFHIPTWYQRIRFRFSSHCSRRRLPPFLLPQPPAAAPREAHPSLPGAATPQQPALGRRASPLPAPAQIRHAHLLLGLPDGHCVGAPWRARPGRDRLQPWHGGPAPTAHSLGRPERGHLGSARALDLARPRSPRLPVAPRPRPRPQRLLLKGK